LFLQSIIDDARDILPMSQAIYQHLDLQQNVFAVSLALEDLNRNSVEIQKSEKTGTGGDLRNSSAR
jgi:hypothetical protein